ncbi:class I SAM-dependent methyltransferase [Rhizobium mesoamericanum]|uniref:class I SAM-dependent methyltransferase n=1 Tax=Rhizobium mesoamericanum TaxID=1079800 RepID=UPI0004261707|nr:class I SAM-dependent methyltransferase [Rhizobium mesoamericanum]
MSTALGEKIKAIIQANGPISVTDYFSLCLADPEHGYYKTREPFGSSGDFVTAPEVSQLFGEMIGVFIVHAWQRHRTPAGVRLVEIGPGRGTMMADMLRVISRIAPPLFEDMTVHLVETSERLRDIQQEALASYGNKISWHQGFDEVPPGFSLLAANELFDAIPIRQFVKTATGFRERMVGIDADGELTFGVGVAGIDPGLLPSPANDVLPGTLLEVSPARQSVMLAICDRLKAFGGSAVVIDYGHLVSGYGDTLQAVRMHEYDPPLAHPGEADLTSHVDFEALAQAASSAGVYVNGLLYQGDFLVGLGILDRAAALGRDREARTRQIIQTAVDRLAGEGEGRMGELFKVLAVSNPAVDLMPFRSVD